MPVDVIELKDFYLSPLGRVVRRIIGRRIRTRWREARGQVVAGMGFATPYLSSFREEAQSLLALMPAEQGALVWPSEGPSKTVLVEQDLLPLPDNSIDRFLVVHGLEAQPGARPVLREIWRVLKPDGRVLLVVPNRIGIWARREATPFGHGLPYSRGQLEKLLIDSLFTPLDWSHALHMPPSDRRSLLRWALPVERLGARIWPAFGGVIIVEATKELAQPIIAGNKVRRAPVFVPAVNGEVAVMTDPPVRVGLAATTKETAA